MSFGFAVKSLLAASLAFAPLAAFGAVVKLLPSADARMETIGVADGTSIYLSVFNNGANVQRTLVRFDLSVLGANANITNAVFKLHADSSLYPGGNPSGQVMEVYRLTQPWAETQVIWTNRTFTAPWSSAGGDAAGTSGTPGLDPYAANNTAVTNNYSPPLELAWDVTTLVEEWYAGIYPNYGLLLLSYPGNGLHFRSRENGANIPILEIYTAPATNQAVLIPAGADWKYLDNGSDQGAAWRAVNFDDSAWTSGPAQLGYGDGDEATIVNRGPTTNRYITTYFRRSFFVADSSFYSNLVVRLLRDDGGVVYLNGVEIVRSQMPAGLIAYNTLASSTVNTGPDETVNFFSMNVPPGLLRTGTNVLAVEIHQVNLISSDISFDLELMSNTESAEAPDPVWVNHPGGVSDDVGRGVALDAAGNLFLVGSFSGTLSFGGTNLVSAGSNDVFLAKYSGAGNVLWVRRAGGVDDDEGRGVALDAAGNCYVAGLFTGAASFGSTNLSGNAGTRYVFLAKYDSTGNFLWVRQLGGFIPLSFEYPYGLGLAADPAGNTWIASFFDGTRSFGGTNLTSVETYDAFVEKLDAAGSTLWVRQAGGLGGEYGQAVGVDAGGNAYVTGHFYAGIDFGSTNLPSIGASDMFLAKYDPAGNVLWAIVGGGSGNGSQWEAGYGVALDATGNCYVTGSFNSPDAVFGGVTLTPRGTNDVFLSKYNPAGGLIWIRQLGGTLNDIGHAIAADAQGHIYVTGYSASTNADFDGVALFTAGGDDIFVAKYDTAGALLWAKRLGGTGNDIGWGVAVDTNGGVYVSGQFESSAEFGGGHFDSSGGSDIFLVKLAEPDPVYFTSFEGAVGPEWSRTNTDVTPIGARRFLGQFGNQIVTLTLTNLPPHGSVELAFDLFAIRSWDGNGNCCSGIDVWDVRAQNGPTLLHTTFSNTQYAGNRQAYPDTYPGGNHLGSTGATETNTLGFVYIEGATVVNPLDSVYHLSFSFAHTSNNLALQFSGSGLQTLTNESWGLDNVQVKVSPAPAPPVLQIGPTNQLVAAGSNATFKVTAIGTAPLTYQWLRNGLALAGATNTSLAITNIQPLDAATFAIAVSNTAGTVTSANAALAVNAPGLVYTSDFSVQPPASLWTTLGLTGAAADVTTGPQVDASVVTLAATAITATLAVANANPPNFSGSAVWSSTGGYLQTRPTGVRMSILLATLVNTTATHAASFAISYDYARVAALAEEIEGHRVYYSLTGTPNSWVNIPQLSSQPPGRLSAIVTPATLWLSGAKLYLLFADDNGSPSPDTANQIDNFSATAISAQPPIIITQPESQVVYIGSTATITMSAGGTGPLDYQWLLNETMLIDGATNASLILTNVQPVNAGNYSVRVSNIVGVATSAVASLTVRSCLSPLTGLVAWWRAENSAFDSIGTNHGMLQNGVGFSAGKVGAAFSFNGNRQFVQVPASGAWDFTVHDGTIDFWLNVTSPSVGGIAAGLVTQINNVQNWAIYVYNDTRIGVGIGGVNEIASCCGVISHGVWHHVAVTRSGDTTSIFVDGNRVASATTPVWTSTSNPLTIGGHTLFGTEYYLNGFMDEIHVFNRALTSNEIAAVYAAGSSGMCPPAPVFVGVQGSGVVSRSPDQALFFVGDVVTLTATNARYYRFLQWADGNTNAQRMIVVGATNNYVALFTNSVPLETLTFKQWDRSFGGTNFDNEPVVRRTLDGGCILGAPTASGVGGNKTTPMCGDLATWIVKLDADGNKQWEQTVGAPGSAYSLVDIEVTSDGGYALAVSSTADPSPVTDNCGKTSAHFGGYDIWLVRLDASGQRLWDQSYGGSGLDAVSAVRQMSDGGFVLAGVSDSPPSGNKSSPNFGGRDMWIVRTDSTGNKLWDRSFGGTATDGALSVALMADGGFLISGNSSSDVSGSKTAPHYGLEDYWVVRLDANGNKLWDRSYGGSGDDNGAWMALMPDGGALLAGYSDSPIGGTRTAPGWGGSDYWVVRINAAGNPLWDRSFGGSGVYDWVYKVQAAADGGVIVVGESDSGSDGNKTTGQFGNSDGWVVRLDAWGNKVSECSLGGTDYDYLSSVDTAGLDGFILAGGSFSDPGGNKTATRLGDEDLWVIKLAERTAPVGTPVILVNGQFNPGNNVLLASNAMVELRTTLTNGYIFYSVDGSNPSDGLFYTGPFVLEAGAMVRAVAFNSNFTASAEADVVAINLRLPPVITGQPAGGVLVLGGSFQLSATAAGTGPLHFQWRLNGADVPGATGPSLLLNSVLPANEGPYRLVVTNDFGAVTSAVALVNVLLPPGIAAHPSDTNVFPGTAVTFCVTVSGSPPIRYQWRRNGVNIPGATNACLTIDPVTVTDSGSYSVVVANDAGVQTSDPARLIVNVPPTPPGDNFADRVAIFGTNGFVVGTNVFATREPGEPLHAGKPGSNSVWYTWTAPATGIATFRTTGSGFDTLLGIYTGTVVSSLTTNASDEDGGGFLTSLVSFNAGAGTNYQIAIDGLGGATGDFVLLWELEVTNATLPVITNQPVSQTVIAGANASFIVGASGTGLRYQWSFFANTLGGQTNVTLTISNVQPSNVGAYTVTVSNSAGRFVTSFRAVLEIGPLSNVQSVDKFEDAVGGGGNGGGGFAPALKGNASASTGSGTSIPVAAGTVASQVLNNTGSQTEPREPNACGVIGASSRWLSLTAASSGILVIDTLGSAIDTVLAVYTNDVSNLLAPLQFVACDNDSAPDGLRSLLRFQAVAGKEYLVAVDGVNGAQGTVQIRWSLGVAPTVQTPSAGSLMYRLGDSVTLSIASTNGVPPPDIQWHRNDLVLPGATNSILELGNIQPGQAGTYSVVVSNYAGAMTSLVAQITVEVPLRTQVALERVGNTLRVHITGAASQGVVLQATSDLVNWMPVQVIPGPNASFEFTDDRTGTQAPRFYRVVPWP